MSRRGAGGGTCPGLLLDGVDAEEGVRIADRINAATAAPADTADQKASGRCRGRADEGQSDVLLDAGQIEPGDADGDREDGPAQQMETR
ncbi:hypothetical protein ACX80S_06035 [Arthrobacter sp. RHLT1-20]